MNQRKARDRSLFNKITIKKFALPITLFAITIGVKLFFVYNNTNSNLVNIKETGTSSTVNINQNNTQNSNLSEWIFYTLMLLSIISLVISYYKFMHSRNENNNI